MKLAFSRQIFVKKKAQISNFINIRPVGIKFFHADGRTDGRTDMTKLRVAFRNFAKAPEMKVISMPEKFFDVL